MSSKERSAMNDESARCPACGAVLAFWMTVPGDWRRPELDVSYTLLRCESCAHGLIHPLPSLEESGAAHNLDHYYTHHDASWQVPTESLVTKL